MIDNIHNLSLPELKDLFIKQSRSFINGLEVGASFEELHNLKEDIKRISHIIEDRKPEKVMPSIRTSDFNFN